MVAADVRPANGSLGRRVGERGPNPVSAAKRLLDPVFDRAARAIDVLVQRAGVDRVRRQEGTMKRGLLPLGRCSAVATTRRVRLQLSSVRQAKSAKRRAGRPCARLEPV
jgi:hypothetical protein